VAGFDIPEFPQGFFDGENRPYLTIISDLVIGEITLYKTGFPTKINYVKQTIHIKIEFADVIFMLRVRTPVHVCFYRANFSDGSYRYESMSKMPGIFSSPCFLMKAGRNRNPFFLFPETYTLE
jgi:hypothetical protein